MVTRDFIELLVDGFRMVSSSMHAEVRSVGEMAVGRNRSALVPSY